MANKGQKGKMSPLTIIGLVLCIGGSVLLNMGMDGLGFIMCIVGIPVAIVSIVLNLKKK